MASNNPHNFANLPKEEVRELAAKGGRASHGDRSEESYQKRDTRDTTSSGDSDLPGNGNPGNFANRPKEEVRAIASKGGQASHSGGFANMDPEKQREIASMGGHASAESGKGGNFANRPTEEVREIGRKGGLARGQQYEEE
ncbi:hypothetical protein K440DRAFT_410591 [Wilcoxina mikolae CBS 423.85]|nr:hypothetical protein K440DRAFT_410591 [Wilcoxina mikolae CBS 423.85]